jgi:hypothetical protein
MEKTREEDNEIYIENSRKMIDSLKRTIEEHLQHLFLFWKDWMMVNKKTSLSIIIVKI